MFYVHIRGSTIDPIFLTQTTPSIPKPDVTITTLTSLSIIKLYDTNCRRLHGWKGHKNHVSLGISTHGHQLSRSMSQLLPRRDPYAMSVALNTLKNYYRQLETTRTRHVGSQGSYIMALTVRKKSSACCMLRALSKAHYEISQPPEIILGNCVSAVLLDKS